MVHDEAAPHSGLAFFLAQFDAPNFPVPLGIFRAAEAPVYEDLYAEQAEAAVAAKGKGNLAKLFNSGNTWNIG